jgi:zinc and cadmium transporter
MMDYIYLLTVAFAGGLLAFFWPKTNNGYYKLALVFAGSYLFSITVIHILPELFHDSGHGSWVGVFVLIGFFLQQILEYISKGIEHGHLHVHEKGHKHLESTAIMAMLALSIHAVLEGSMLSAGSAHHNANTLLWGVLIHKAPEAFALMSVLVCELSRKKSLIYLTAFALASPLGLALSRYLLNADLVSSQFFTFLFALVCGNFLHISTTIVYESSSDHKFNFKKTLVAITGAGIAVLGEMIL